MGDRAHYVIKDGGSYERYYSQWGAYSMELDMLPGPEPAARFVRGQRLDDRWIDEFQCEGAALIDRDEHRLLWYSDHLDDVAYRAAALAVMVRTWPGWRVEWAYDGLSEILAALGEDPRQVRGPRAIPVPDDVRTPEDMAKALPQLQLDPDIYPPGSELPRELPIGPPLPQPARESDGWPSFLVTVSRQSRVEAYMVNGGVFGVIENGVGTLERYRAWSPVTTWPYFPYGGVHLDVDTRTGEVWTTGTLNRVLAETETTWPGWRWTCLRDDHREQLARAHTLTLPEPDLAQGVRRLTKEFDSHQKVDSATKGLSALLGVTGMLKSAAESAGIRASTNIDNGFAHRPMDLTTGERAEVHTVLAALRDEV